MSSLARSTQTTNPALESDPATWPDWTNERWELGPDPSTEDADWAASVFNADTADFDVEDIDPENDPAYLAWLDARAAESARMDRLEGLIPADVALAINRTSLAGSDATADSILHEGSDERFCICESCVWARTSRYAD